MTTLSTLQVGEILISGDYRVKRGAVYYCVKTPYGGRRVRKLSDVAILLNGGWPCSKCGRNLPLSHYPLTMARRWAYPRSWCKDCEGMRQAVWFSRNKRRLRAVRRVYMQGWRNRDRTGYNTRYRIGKLRRAMRLQGVR